MKEILIEMVQQKNIIYIFPEIDGDFKIWWTVIIQLLTSTADSWRQQ
jgi:hypothetical protein